MMILSFQFSSASSEYHFGGLMTPMLSSAGFVCLPVSRGLLGGI